MGLPHFQFTEGTKVFYVLDFSTCNTEQHHASSGAQGLSANSVLAEAPVLLSNFGSFRCQHQNNGQ